MSLKVFILFSVVLFLSGCSSDLDRADAESLLSKRTDWGVKTVRVFAVTSPDESIRNRTANTPFLEAMAAAGYLIKKPGSFDSGQVSGGAHGCGPISARPFGLLTCKPHTYITWYPTEKLLNRNEAAKLDQGGWIEFNLAHARLRTVTGVAKVDEDLFKVDFTEMWDISKPGDLAIKYSISDQIGGNEKTLSRIVRKYDDEKLDTHRSENLDTHQSE